MISSFDLDLWSLEACGIMAIIPAHIMRSVGGKFDNEAVAMTAIVMTLGAESSARSRPRIHLKPLKCIYFG